MASLSSYETRTPRWLGNDRQEEPFRLEIKRLTVSELRAFLSRNHALRARGESATAADIRDLFAPVVRGPIGNLTIEGETVTDLGRLLEIASLELSTFEDNLIAEILTMISEVNRLDKLTLGESRGSHGSGSTTRTEDPGAGSPAENAGA